MTLRTVLLFGLVAGALGGAAPVMAGPLPELALQARGDQAVVVRSFQSILKRDPHPYELRRYALLMDDYGWTAQDVRQALRRSDEGRGQRGVGPAALSQDPVTLAVRNAYLAVLDREPDAAGLRDYGARVVQDNWSQADIEKALRDSPEYKTKNR